MSEAVKLTEAQRLALEGLKSGPCSAYGLFARLNTLHSLEKRHLVFAQRGPGSFFCPQTAIKWRITPAGRAALQREDTK